MLYLILESLFYQTDEYAHYKSKYGKSSLKISTTVICFGFIYLK